jgi:hypothetical protein
VNHNIQLEYTSCDSLMLKSTMHRFWQCLKAKFFWELATIQNQIISDLNYFNFFLRLVVFMVKGKKKTTNFFQFFIYFFNYDYLLNLII